MMTRTPVRSRLVLSAAALAVAALSGGALAQYRVDRSGATDANARVGSGGINQVDRRPNSWDVQNNIVYGNVTGGKQFRGGVSSTDPLAFRGGVASRNYDTFVRDSSGVTTGGIPTYNANTTRAYYGDSRVVTAPAGTVGVTNTGGYTPPTPQAYVVADPRKQPLGVTSTANAPGTTDALGSLGDPFTPSNTAPQSFVAPGGLGFGSQYTNLNSTTVNQLTPAQIRQIQSGAEVSQVPGQSNVLNGTDAVSAGSRPQQTGTPGGGMPGALSPTAGQVNADRINRPENTPTGQSQPNYGTQTTPAGQRPSGARPLNNNASGTATTPGAAALDDSVQPDSVTSDAGPSETGLVTRMRPQAGKRDPNAGLTGQPTRPGQAAEDASRQFNAALRQKQKDADKGDGKGDSKGGDKPADKTPALPDAGPAAGKSAPSNLTPLMERAEEQTKTGKYASAIESYDAAEALSPGNATVALGRANAELGGAFYRRSATTLRRVARTDFSVLAKQNDLRGALGDDRLTAVQKDLSDLVQKAPAIDDNASILLAYVYYNTGNERRAAALLDLAEKKTQGKDPLVAQLKKAWGGAGDETK